MKPEDIKGLSGDKLLKSFMKEQFDFNALLKAGFFTKEMRGDYKAQAERVCRWFGFKTVYEYGSREISCHLTEDGSSNFITTVPNIYKP
jgi:hypothetical protein